MPLPIMVPVKSIPRARLASSDPDPNTFAGEITFNPNHSISITPSTEENRSEDPLALPALTHPHIHLDKAFVHSALPSGSHLPSTGSFQEALSLTAQAKAQFRRTDLLRRGTWLLADSVASGVTAMRAFVEVDQTVGLACLDAGKELQTDWEEVCRIQLVCFAQDPIFSGEVGDANRALLEEALARYPCVDVIGTTPYVEASGEAARRNIDWAVTQALRLGKHVDFHLDYNLDGEREALVWYVLDVLQRNRWTASTTDKRVMLGHCTRLTLFKHEEWSRLAEEIRRDNLPVSFVGLPTSDLYMAAQPGSGDDGPSNGQPRGTLPVPEMIRKYNLDAVIGVNNVGNAFTPWGSLDPLSLACLGVGVYQAGTQADATLLYECVSTRARAAIGLPLSSGLTLKDGDPDELLLFYRMDDTGCAVPRSRTRVADLVWDPPARVSRSVVIRGAAKMIPKSLLF